MDPTAVDTESTPQTGAGDLAAAITELANLMLATSSVQQMLDDVARLASQIVSPPAPCGITIQRDDAPLTIATSHHLAALVDEIQYHEGNGPCLESMRTSTLVYVPDLSVETRWGTYPAEAAGNGVRSSLSLPLVSNGESRGALNLYGTLAHAFPPGPVQSMAQAFASQAAAVISVVVRQARQAELTSQLREALGSRSVIDQAIGIIMDQRRCDAGAAFERLRAVSQNQNRKLRDVAADMVTTMGGRSVEPTPFHEPRPRSIA